MIAQRLLTCLTAAIAALAVGAPFAWAGPGIVDDSWRDAPRSTQATLATPDRQAVVYRLDGRGTATTNRIVDDYFREAQPSINQSPGVTNRIVDDYFRDAAPAAAAANGFHWGDFGIGIAVAFGAMLLLAGVGAGALAAHQTRSRTTSPAAGASLVRP
jgi:hypothetical protein